MPIRIKCSSCDTALRAPDNAAGKKVKCKCGAILQIPAASAPAPVAAPPKIDLPPEMDLSPQVDLPPEKGPDLPPDLPSGMPDIPDNFDYGPKVDAPAAPPAGAIPDMPDIPGLPGGVPINEDDADRAGPPPEFKEMFEELVESEKLRIDQSGMPLMASIIAFAVLMGICGWLLPYGLVIGLGAGGGAAGFLFVTIKAKVTKDFQDQLKALIEKYELDAAEMYVPIWRQFHESPILAEMIRVLDPERAVDDLSMLAPGKILNNEELEAEKRTEVIPTLKESGGLVAIDRLVNALGDSEISEEVSDALLDMDGEVVEGLILGLETSKLPHRVAVIYLLGERKDLKAEDPLRRMRKDKRDAVKVSIDAALMKLGVKP
jgi:hypothetical protein